MQLDIIDIKQGTESTLTLIAVDKKVFCNALQDTDRGLVSTMPLDDILQTKIQDRTAIPTGTYKVVLDYSNRFKRIMPHILNVPGFEGIRIHAGNYVGDTDGCILVGINPDQDKLGYYRVWESRDTFARLFALLQAAVDRHEEIWCTVSRNYVVEAKVASKAVPAHV